jgi:hypothetical protein
MTVHPKILERANNILSQDEQDALHKIEEITNDTVLNVIYEQEITGQKRQSIVNFLTSKLNIQEGSANKKTTDTLANQYLGNIVESEEETFVFDTSIIRDKDEEEEVVDDSSIDSIELS